jgi:hypothetical protein
MKDTDPFDAMLDFKAVQAKTSVARSAPEVRDMLKLAWTAAQSVFGKAAKPEHAVMLLPTFLAKADAERQRLLAEASARTSGEATPPSSGTRSRAKG